MSCARAAPLRTPRAACLTVRSGSAAIAFTRFVAAFAPFLAVAEAFFIVFATADVRFATFLRVAVLRVAAFDRGVAFFRVADFFDTLRAAILYLPPQLARDRAIRNLGNSRYMDRDPVLERLLIAGAVDQIVTLLQRPQDLDADVRGTGTLRTKLQNLRTQLSGCLDDDPSLIP